MTKTTSCSLRWAQADRILLDELEVGSCLQALNELHAQAAVIVKLTAKKKAGGKGKKSSAATCPLEGNLNYWGNVVKRQGMTGVGAHLAGGLRDPNSKPHSLPMPPSTANQLMQKLLDRGAWCL